MPSSSLDALTPCLYSCAAFWVINTALRSKHKGHPLATWVIKIYEALKKLRALHLMSTQKFRSRYLWRGLKDRKVSHTPHIYILTFSETLTRVRARTLSVLNTHAHTQHVPNDIALYYIPTFGEPEAFWSHDELCSPCRSTSVSILIMSQRHTNCTNYEPTS